MKFERFKLTYFVDISSHYFMSSEYTAYHANQSAVGRGHPITKETIHD